MKKNLSTSHFQKLFITVRKNKKKRVQRGHVAIQKAQILRKKSFLLFQKLVLIEFLSSLGQFSTILPGKAFCKLMIIFSFFSDCNITDPYESDDESNNIPGRDGRHKVMEENHKTPSKTRLQNESKWQVNVLSLATKRKGSFLKHSMLFHLTIYKTHFYFPALKMNPYRVNKR